MIYLEYNFRTLGIKKPETLFRVFYIKFLYASIEVTVNSLLGNYQDLQDYLKRQN